MADRDPKSPRVFFLLPGPYVYEDRCQAYIGRGSVFGYREPVEEMAAARAMMAKGADCALCHAAAEGLSAPSILSRIASFAPDLVILSTTFPGHASDLAWAAKIKAALPGCVVAARGGQMPFVNRQRLFSRFPDLDAIVLPDYDESLSGWMAQGFSGPSPGILLRDRPEPEGLPSAFSGLLVDLHPARRIVVRSAFRSPDTGEPLATILAGAGCGRRCSFCLAPMVSGRTPLFREPEEIAGEMAKARAELGFRRYFLRADDLCADRTFVLSLCETLARYEPGARFVTTARADGVDDETARALARAGCWGLSLGLESGSQQTLSRTRKGLTPQSAERALAACRRHGIMTLGYFMLGFPWETKDDVMKTLEAARRLAPDVCEFFFPYPFPGTALYEEAASLGLVREDSPPPCSQVVPVCVPPGMSPQELIRLRNQARRAPRALLRAARAILRQARTPADALHIATSRLAALPRALFPPSK
ncbi:MAG: B12-binding domain-containing radical SAM protein [Thermodesulfobacteriota bacterium]